MRRALLAVTAASTLALSACGAEEASVVKTAFEQDIESADVTVALSMKSAQGESNVSLSGPFQSNGENKLPSVDWRLSLDGMMPRPVEGRIISTGDDAFVQYGGETYQVGKDKIAQLGALGAGSGMESADVTKLMARMQDWFPESDAQSDAELNGERVTRITGKLDLSAALEDMKEMAKQPGASGFEGLEQLSNGDIDQVEKMISDPTFTVDVAQSDDKLRRVAARMTVDNGSDKSTISFSIQLKDVDKPVQITPPASGRPIEELMQKLQQDFGRSVPEETTIS
ncbi:hypothetical protein DVA67_005915 [Solirubrobacter sp. CPCC 204708]|uniref:LppX_LprAFG lipoprotein n=1 Tax=Solirubrobacter deserti TaxID=2282478 RepID=A0ABT4RCA6_9ACTN|nr:hypothetical protein [Solirubrobacter deserti]MBE2315502.1 hypothetical protein [Solirubrobacter deserti]MDA0136141.1 hypothetical protein [Solirubrobacter deserti]